MSRVVIETPQTVIAKFLGLTKHPSPYRMNEALKLIEALVEAGYAIEPIEDEDNAK